MVLLLFEFYSSLNFAFSWFHGGHNEIYNKNFVHFPKAGHSANSFTNMNVQYSWTEIIL